MPLRRLPSSRTRAPPGGSCELRLSRVISLITDSVAGRRLFAYTGRSAVRSAATSLAEATANVNPRRQSVDAASSSSARGGSERLGHRRNGCVPQHRSLLVRERLEALLPSRPRAGEARG